MIIHVFTNPHRAWVCVCDDSGIVQDAAPETVRSQWVGQHVEGVHLAATSILRHYVEAIDDNEYPTHVEVRDLEPLRSPEVFRSGIKLREVGTED